MSKDQKNACKVIYADGVSKIGISPFMSKMTFDVLDTSESIVLVLPTSELLNLTKNLLESFSKPDLQQGFDKTHENIKDILVDMVKKLEE